MTAAPSKNSPEQEAVEWMKNFSSRLLDLTNTAEHNFARLSGRTGEIDNKLLEVKSRLGRIERKLDAIIDHLRIEATDPE